LHDPAVYSEPLEFQPERYLKDGQPDPDVKNPDCAAFGFGRRWVTQAPESLLCFHSI